MPEFATRTRFLVLVLLLLCMTAVWSVLLSANVLDRLSTALIVLWGNHNECETVNNFWNSWNSNSAPT